MVTRNLTKPDKCQINISLSSCISVSSKLPQCLKSNLEDDLSMLSPPHCIRLSKPMAANCNEMSSQLCGTVFIWPWSWHMANKFLIWYQTKFHPVYYWGRRLWLAGYNYYSVYGQLYYDSQGEAKNIWWKSIKIICARAEKIVWISPAEVQDITCLEPLSLDLNSV